MELKITEKNLQHAAEVLRDWIFVGSGTGCYHNFDLRDGFVKIDKDKDLIKKIKLMMAYEGYFEEPDSVINAPYAFHHPEENIYVAWHWDGDGTLLIGYNGEWIINHDCKCNYTWEYCEAILDHQM